MKTKSERARIRRERRRNLIARCISLAKSRGQHILTGTYQFFPCRSMRLRKKGVIIDVLLHCNVRGYGGFFVEIVHRREIVLRASGAYFDGPRTVDMHVYRAGEWEHCFADHVRA